MINILNKKIEKKLVLPQINNKLLVRYSNKSQIQIIVSNNFKINNSRDFKLMKNIIAMELLLGQRPSIVASLIKKSLVINLKITTDITKLKLLQKRPIPWDFYLQNFNIFDQGFYIPSLVVKNLKFNLTLKTKKISLIDNWVKSAYLD